MKKLQLVFLLMVSFAIFSNGQNQDYQNGVGLFFRGQNATMFGDNDFDANLTSYMVDLSYGRNLTPWLNIQIPVGAALSLDPEFALTGVHGDILAQIGTFSSHKVAAPYLYLGPSFFLGKDAADELSVFDVAARVGAGVNIKIANPLLLNIHAGYTTNFEENNNGALEAGLGFIFLFGQGSSSGGSTDMGMHDDMDHHSSDSDMASKTEPTEDEKKAAKKMAKAGKNNRDEDINLKKLKKSDTDEDGIPDLEDDCPNTAGVEAFKGCPDTDKDGIRDLEDQCPEEAGTVSTLGCPDTDKDGVPDKTDKCPDVAGEMNYNGCPFFDRDNDKVVDDEDDCPDTPGLLRFKGCPDTDSDGVPDNIDKCIDKIGTLEAEGCPDTDGDSIPDHLDKCPTKAGVLEKEGCPAANQTDLNTLTSVARGLKWETGDSTLSADATKQVDKLVTLLKANSKYNLHITGYSDSDTPEFQVAELAMARAKAIKERLVTKGIAESRLTFSGDSTPKVVTRKVKFDLK